jgi:hypothetical protein
MKIYDMKIYPLTIWTLEGDYAASWGHHPLESFAQILREEWGIDAKASQINQGYARVGFDGESGRRCIYSAKGPGRGVRPITEWERI